MNCNYNLLNKKNILTNVNILINKLVYNHIFLKKTIQKHILGMFSGSQIIFYTKNNWSSIFPKIDKTKLTFVIDDDGFLPFLYFSKQIKCTVSMPNDALSSSLSRAHNDSNVCVLALNNIKPSNISSIINKYLHTKFEGGRHALRLSIMHNSFKKGKSIIKFKAKNNHTIILGNDHAGYDIKQTIKKHLIKHNFNVIDVGTFSKESTHYPLYAIAMLQHAKSAFCAIAICFTGFGIANTCNKFMGALSCICSNKQQAIIARKKYGANILSIGARNVTTNSVNKIVDAFLKTTSCKPNTYLLHQGYNFSYSQFSKLKIDKKLLPKELKKFN